MHKHTRFFNQPIFPELFQVRLLQVSPVHKSKLLGIVVAELLQAGCQSRQLNNGIETLKNKTKDKFSYAKNNATETE